MGNINHPFQTRAHGSPDFSVPVIHLLLTEAGEAGITSLLQCKLDVQRENEYYRDTRLPYQNFETSCHIFDLHSHNNNCSNPTSHWSHRKPEPSVAPHPFLPMENKTNAKLHLPTPYS